VVPSVVGFATAGIEAPDSAALASRPEVREKIQKEIRRLVSGETGFKPFERIAALDLLEKPFEVGDELTMTFKLKRHIIAEKYSRKIGEMFEG
jgi:long-chain acyl-CoA synthetase